MRTRFMALCIVISLILSVSVAFSAYHHEGEMDSWKFLAVYPEKAGTKLDHCALCHSGGTYTDSKNREVTLRNCQLCHYTYGYDGSGNIVDTLNQFGIDYFSNGRNEASIVNIKIWIQMKTDSPTMKRSRPHVSLEMATMILLKRPHHSVFIQRLSWRPCLSIHNSC